MIYVEGSSKVNEHSEHVGEGLAIDIINRRPSVEHYYHFVLGFLVPLVRRIATEVENGSPQYNLR